MSENPNHIDPSFNSVMQTQGGLPHLLELLKQEYRKHMAAVNQKREAQHQECLAIEKTIDAAAPFLRFCEKYLVENRPVQVFPVDMNYGLVLANSLRCVVSPGVADIRGTMQNSNVVAISTGMQQDQGVVGL